MKNRRVKEEDLLIELINRATPDSLNIAHKILQQNGEFDIQNLSVLWEYVEESCAAKTNRELSARVRKLKQKIIAGRVSKSSPVGV